MRTRDFVLFELVGIVFLGMGAAAYCQVPSDLGTAGNTFTANSHYVSTTVFTWYDSAGGQLSGPWRPVEGRSNWTGTPAFWQTQIKQMMVANIDVMQVELFSDNGGGWYDQGRTNLFQALRELRTQGYNVPKVVPFLDTAISTSRGWTPGTAGKAINLLTTAGKDAFVQQYINFYNQYYSVNTDAGADSYVAQIDGRVVLDTWHLNTAVGIVYPESMSRANVQSRLAAALGGSHPLFGSLPANGIFMIRPASSSLGFADETLTQFELTAYYDKETFASRQAAQVKGGYWDQNIRNPGSILPRDGGTHYADAWSSVQAAKSGGLRHVNIESWNEYDEGSGIYAADPGPPYIQPGSGNTNTDTWSATNDPYEYIKTTAEGARLFNDTPDRGARILWNNLPTMMTVGETRTYQVVVRNDGDLSWTGAAGFKFGEVEYADPTMFGAGRYYIDDNTNEISSYGGIFRGRPITFDVTLTAPTTPGTYTTHWRMVHEGVTWFGEELVLPITVAVPEPSSIALLGIGAISLLAYVWRRRK